MEQRLFGGKVVPPHDRCDDRAALSNARGTKKAAFPDAQSTPTRLGVAAIYFFSCIVLPSTFGLGVRQPFRQQKKMHVSGEPEVEIRVTQASCKEQATFSLQEQAILPMEFAYGIGKQIYLPRHGYKSYTNYGKSK